VRLQERQRIRITAQLIDAKDGVHRTIDDIVPCTKSIQPRPDRPLMGRDLS
jgi:TolB-like protein